MPFRKALGIVAIIAAVIMLADQASKHAVMGWLDQNPHNQITLAPFAKVVWVWNKGMSFGMFNAEEVPEWQPYIFITLALLISGFLLWWLKSDPRQGSALAIGAVIGGAFGNVIDRMYLPGVFDFVYLHAGGYAWPAFNVADAAICCGALALFFLSIRPPKAVETDTPKSENEPEMGKSETS